MILPDYVGLSVSPILELLQVWVIRCYCQGGVEIL